MPRLAFKNESTMDQLLLLLTVDDCHYSLPALKIFVTLSSYKPLGKQFMLILFPLTIMVQTLPWVVDSYSTDQEIPCFYRTHDFITVSIKICH